MVHFKMCCYGDAGGNVIKGQHNQQLTLVDSLSFIYSHYFAAKDLNLRFQCGTGAVSFVMSILKRSVKVRVIFDDWKENKRQLNLVRTQTQKWNLQHLNSLMWDLNRQSLKLLHHCV